MPAPKLLAMLIKQGIEGDDALLRLRKCASRRRGWGRNCIPQARRNSNCCWHSAPPTARVRFTSRARSTCSGPRHATG